MSGALNVAAIVLAAGCSSRMGPRNKLVLPIDGVPMVRRVVDTLQSSCVQSVVVVTGHESECVAAVLAGSGAQTTYNERYEEGMGTSLACGFRLVDCAHAALLCLGDMPFVLPATIDQLIGVFESERAARICLPVFNGRQGHPVLFDRCYFEELGTLGADRGARRIVEAAGGAVVELPTNDAGVLRDIDREDDL